MRVEHASARTDDCISTIEVKLDSRENDARIIGALSGLPFVIKMTCVSGLLTVTHVAPEDDVFYARIVTLLKSGENMLDWNQETILCTRTERVVHSSVPGLGRVARRKAAPRHAAHHRARA